MDGKTLETQVTTEPKIYETEYKYEVRDPDILFEVAKAITADPDFRDQRYGEGSRIGIGVSGNKSVSEWPSFFVNHNQDLFFRINIFSTFWNNYLGRVERGEAPREELDNLLKEYWADDLTIKWLHPQGDLFRGEIVNLEGSVVASFDPQHFSYQFGDMGDYDKEDFIADLNEALTIQQIMLTVAHKREAVGIFRAPLGPGLIIGNPYLYFGHRIAFDAVPKFKALQREYLANRLPDIEEARRVFPVLVSDLEAAELEAKKLRAQLWEAGEKERGRRIRQRLRGHWGEANLKKDLPDHCAVLGLNPDIFKTLSNDEARSLVEQLRRFWARIHHPDRGGSEELMKKVNDAADFLGDEEKRG